MPVPERDPGPADLTAPARPTANGNTDGRQASASVRPRWPLQGSAQHLHESQTSLSYGPRVSAATFCCRLFTRESAYKKRQQNGSCSRGRRVISCDRGRVGGTLSAAAVGLIATFGLAACGDQLALDLNDPPRPQRTQPPTQLEAKIAWLGPRFGQLRFHSVDRHPPPLIFVRYGEPTPPDPGSGDVWHFALTVSTAPRRQTTARRLRRTLGTGVPVQLGTRYGCRHADAPRRVAVLTATVRIEITRLDCSQLLAASRKLTIA